MTANGQSQGMRRLAVLLAVLSLLALAGTAGAGGVPPFPRLPGAWSHADINVTIKKKPHTLTLDRGQDHPGFRDPADAARAGRRNITVRSCR